MKRACVVGSGPNGLSAAIALARAGLQVDVYEAEAEAGGSVRTMALTEPGFLHDFGSAVFPLAAGSPFFNPLPLGDFGLEWVHGEAPLAHPLDDGSAVVLDKDLAKTERLLGLDGREWRTLVEPLASNWSEFAEDALGPLMRIPRHPLRMASIGLTALQTANSFARSHFTKERTRALFAGLAGHSFLSFDERMSATTGLMLGITAHAVGWPISRGGAGALSRALIGYFESLGGRVHTSRRVDVEAFREMDAEGSLVFFDTSPRQMAAIAGERFKPEYRMRLEQFRAASGAFKIDYALAHPVPWRSADCYRAITVHLGGTLGEVAAAEDAVAHGRCADKPFVLVAQPTLFDPSRAPERKHVLWAYCHVPNGSSFDMTERIEAQIERFAPGFKDCVLARRVWSPADLESMDANLLGGDISGGAMTLRQMLFRPTASAYATDAANVYLCSASTPPGAGVHGMCGYYAAKLALKKTAASRSPMWGMSS